MHIHSLYQHFITRCQLNLSLMLRLTYTDNASLKYLDIPSGDCISAKIMTLLLVVST